MRKSSILFAALFAALASAASAGPRMLTYQGSVLKSDRQPVRDGTYRVRLTLYDGESTGSQKWTETDTVEVVGGLFSTTLGDQTPFTTQFSYYFDLWMEVEIDLDNDGFEIEEIYVPRQRLTGAPWAVEADRLQGADKDFFQRRVTGQAQAGQYICAIDADGSVATADDRDTYDWPSITGKPSAFPPDVHGHDWTELGGIPAGFADDIDNDTHDWPSLTGIPAGFADNIDNDSGGDITAVYAGTGLTGGGTSGAVSLALDVAHIGGLSWSLSGNTGTTSGTDFLGTTDAIALDLRTSAARALRLEPTDTAPNLIGGHEANFAIRGVVGATIGGGGRSGEPNRALEDFATVGGGTSNTASGIQATVSGGYRNIADGNRATVGGGRNNVAWHYAVVAGGRDSGAMNYSTVAGGRENAAWDYSNVAGGSSNAAVGGWSACGGGSGNVITNLTATIAGGWNNYCSGDTAAVAGGRDVRAIGAYSSIGGGRANWTSGTYATVAGGRDNSAAARYSFAAGRRAKAIHRGAFVWADANTFDFDSITTNQFSVRATGGARVVSAIDGNGSPTAGVKLAAGDGSWSSLSDRNLKENFEAVDGREILERLASVVPVATWNYKAQGPSIRHMGPTAQDLHAAFGLGSSDKGITTIDADGVALAAIQGLYQIAKEKDAEIAAQQNQIAGQQNEIEALKARLAVIEERLANH